MGRKVHYSVDSAHYFAKLPGVAYVACNQLKTVGKKSMSGGEVVINQNFISMPSQRPRRMAADITRATHYQNSHVAASLIGWCSLI
jgi:hypothetical protein